MNFSPRFVTPMFSAILLLSARPGLAAQGTRTDYARAEQLLPWNANELVIDDAVRPRWMAGERFWYRNRGERGYEFLVVDLASGAKRAAFDHARLASALSLKADTTFDPAKLPFREISWVRNEQAIRFSVGRNRFWVCDVTSYACEGPDTTQLDPPNEVKSPDGRLVAFERGGNLFVRPAGQAASGEVQLTTDGTPDHGYALGSIGCCLQVTNARNRTEIRPLVLWSPDSKRLVTHKWDQRGVRQMHLLESRNPGPILHSYRYALPGDSVIPRFELYVFDVAERRGVRANRPASVAINTSCCWLATDTVWKDVRWAGPETIVATFGARSFDTLEVAAIDARTGAVRTLLTETSRTYVETNQNSGGIPNWRPIGGSRELVWWSERDGWGHLYLIDGGTGAVKNRITSGDWMVSDLLWIDETLRLVYFTARGREPGHDRYHRLLYRARLDGASIELLTPETGDHDVAFSPSGKHMVDVYSRPNAPPVSVLRRPDGTVIKELQTANVARLVAAGFRPPLPFVVKARDGVTDLHGLLWRPANFDSTKRYPIVDYIYPGPQVGSLGGRQFRAAANGNANALAELGFFVVQVDALGTPGRSKAFHDAYYGNMGDNGIPDQIATIKQLAARHSQIDIDRVGIYGHSGGGFSSTDAILRYPDFFKVAVSSAGNHDNRSYDYTWGEKYQGLWKKLSDSVDTFDAQSNWRLARNLKGKLLLSYGTLDDNVHPIATQLVVDELIKHNKDFDLVVMPNRNHGYAGEPYWLRRTWDYFVRHLLGVEPPAGYEIKAPPAP